MLPRATSDHGCLFTKNYNFSVACLEAAFAARFWLRVLFARIMYFEPVNKVSIRILRLAYNSPDSCLRS